MPMYLWRDNVTTKEIEVIRGFKEYEVPPTKEEAPLSEEEFSAANWERLLSGGIKKQHGDNWGPGKGKWGK